MHTTTSRPTSGTYSPETHIVSGLIKPEELFFKRDTHADETAALRTADPIDYLYQLGYDCRNARVGRRVTTAGA